MRFCACHTHTHSLTHSLTLPLLLLLTARTTTTTPTNPLAWPLDCTYDVRLITKLAFDIFDIDRQGVLDLYECDALLRMVYDVDDIDDIEGPPSGKEILAEMDVNGDGDVTIDEFGDLMESHMYAITELKNERKIVQSIDRLTFNILGALHAFDHSKT